MPPERFDWSDRQQPQAGPAQAGHASAGLAEVSPPQAAASRALPDLLVRTRRSDHQGQRGTPFSVGRDPKSDIVMTDSRVSWRHGVLRVEGEQWIFEDLGSTNGTFLGTQRLERIDIGADCVVRLGNPDDGPILRCAPQAAASPAAPPAPAPQPAHPGTALSVPPAPATPEPAGDGGQAGWWQPTPQEQGPRPPAEPAPRESFPYEPTPLERPREQGTPRESFPREPTPREQAPREPAPFEAPPSPAGGRHRGGDVPDDSWRGGAPAPGSWGGGPGGGAPGSAPGGAPAQDADPPAPNQAPAPGGYATGQPSAPDAYAPSQPPAPDAYARGQDADARAQDAYAPAQDSWRGGAPAPDSWAGGNWPAADPGTGRSPIDPRGSADAAWSQPIRRAASPPAPERASDL